MEHGKDHDERQQKSGRSRRNNTPVDADTELEHAATAQRSGVRPREGVIGPYEERIPPARRDVGGPAAPSGSEFAPTGQAERRERLRHRIEMEHGRTAGGIDGRARDTRAPGVSREVLDEAARQADRLVADGEEHDESEVAVGMREQDEASAEEEGASGLYVQPDDDDR